MSDNEGSQNQKHRLKDKSTEYFILNYDASSMFENRRAEYGERSLMARLNLVMHTYLFPEVQAGDEINEDVVACLYTMRGIDDKQFRTTTSPNFAGVYECKHDQGKIQIN